MTVICLYSMKAEGAFNYFSDVSYDTATCRMDVCGGRYIRKLGHGHEAGVIYQQPSVPNCDMYMPIGFPFQLGGMTLHTFTYFCCEAYKL
jgi:hypothetical protein